MSSRKLVKLLPNFRKRGVDTAMLNLQNNYPPTDMKIRTGAHTGEKSEKPFSLYLRFTHLALLQASSRTRRHLLLIHKLHKIYGCPCIILWISQ